ncbi:hypothetical protein CHS0354_009728 [Potamilus streckersoni]|uniref:Retrotransposon gag domain-containing protein n=1 Tax=Potamilus streckersoni TaxID=2493646 RepID=A0AAE0S063_9BIVA|nr:hypothetical protein CHS0354_009728 [Potamilus streckersoni]
MNRGVTPRNYDLRNRIISKLLPPSHFTPPKATAPPYSQEKIQVPSTSLLLEAAATFTTPPVTIHTPLSTLETISTSLKCRLTSAFQSLFDHGSTAHSTPASNLGPVTQCPIDLTPSTFEGLSQLHEPVPISPMLVTPKSTLFTTNSLNITRVTETITFGVQPLTLKTPEQYSRSVNIFGNDSHKQLQGHAKIRYDTLPESVTNDWQNLVTTIKSRFQNDHVILDLSILQTQQGSSESVMDYLSRLLQFATNKTIPDHVLLAVALNGLKRSVKRIPMNKNPVNMAELRQAAILAEKSITTTDTTDCSTLHTILDEVKQLKDEIKVANSKQNQDSNSCSQTHALINVTRQPFYTRNTNNQPRARYFRQNTDNAPLTLAVPKSYPRTNCYNKSHRGNRYQPQPQNGPPLLVLDMLINVHHEQSAAHATHRVTIVIR